MILTFFYKKKKNLQRQQKINYIHKYQYVGSLKVPK